MHDLRFDMKTDELRSLCYAGYRVAPLLRRRRCASGTGFRTLRPGGLKAGHVEALVD